MRKAKSDASDTPRQSQSPSPEIVNQSTDQPQPRVVPISVNDSEELSTAAGHSAGALRLRLAKLISRDHPMATDSAYSLYRFEDGRYRAVDEQWLGEKCLSYMGDNVLIKSKFCRNFLIETEVLLKIGATKLWEEPPAGKVCLLNGILDLNRNPLPTTPAPLTPSWLSTTQVPILYDSMATCPKWDKFLGEVFPEDAIQVAHEILGVCLTTDRTLQEAIWLQGSGGNGKSTFLAAVMAFVGQQNVATIPLKDLTSDRFATAGLYGKLVDLDDETPVDTLNDVGIFKRIVAHDEIRAQKKWGHAFEFRPYAQVILAGNVSPECNDHSYGFLRRVVMIPFRGMVGSSIKPRPQAEILAELSTPSELSGVLNKAIEGWKRVKKNGAFSKPESVQDAIAEFREDADIIGRYVAERVCVTERKEDFTTRQDIKESYEEWRKVNHMPTTSPGTICEWIERNHPACRHMRNGPRSDRGPWGVTGVRLALLAVNTK